MLSLITSILFVSSVAAAQGKLFKGHSIINVIWGSHKINSGNDVPAIILENRTMLPVNLLKQVGFTIENKGNVVTITDKRQRYLKMIESLHLFKRKNMDVLAQNNQDISNLLQSIISNELKEGDIDSLIKKISEFKSNVGNSAELLHVVSIGTEYPYAMYGSIDASQAYIEALTHLKLYLSYKNKEEWGKFISEKKTALELTDNIESKYNELMNQLLAKIHE